MFPKILTQIFGSRNDRLLETYRRTVESINALEPRFESLSDAELRARTDEFRQRCAAGVTLDELLEMVPGPDFPTGGTIMGRSGIRNAYASGRGSVVCRAKYHVEEKKGRKQIVFTEGRLLDGDGNILAKASSTIRLVPNRHRAFDEVSELEQTVA